VTSVSVGPTRGDITRFLCVRLGEDDILDAMDASLEADILRKIPENMSQMCVGPRLPRITLYVIRSRYLDINPFIPVGQRGLSFSKNEVFRKNGIFFNGGMPNRALSLSLSTRSRKLVEWVSVWSLQ